VPVSSLPLPKNEEKSFRPGGEAPGQHELLLCDAGHYQPPSSEGWLCSVYLPTRDTWINRWEMVHLQSRWQSSAIRPASSTGLRRAWSVFVMPAG